MKTDQPRSTGGPGFSLLECVVSLGVLAMTVPVILAALGMAGHSHESSMTETAALPVVPACFHELQAAREGRSAWFDPLPFAAFPEPDQVMALAIGEDGAVLGSIGATEYHTGIRTWNGGMVHALVRVSGNPADADTPALVVRVAVERPAVARAGHRRVSEFTGMIR